MPTDRVFATGTGRCGTVTFSEACKHITNWDARHESDWQVGPPSLIDYPAGRIEVSPHLVYWIPDLLERYPDAFWVHLVREEVACVDSLADRCAAEMSGWGYQWYGLPDPRNAAIEFYRATNALVRQMLPSAMTIGLSHAKDRFRDFWDAIGAKGDLQAALAEFDTKHNARV